MKYIDAEELLSLLRKRYNTYKIGQHGPFRNGKVETLRETIELIDSLQQEQQEVDLDDEIEKELRLHYNDDQDVYWWNYLKNSFRRFYELGKNSK